MKDEKPLTIMSLQDYLTASTLERVRMEIKQMELKVNHKANWSVVEGESGIAGIFCAKHKYFIEEHRLLAENPEDFNSVDHWLSHLTQKNWFNDNSKLSFLHACKKVLENYEYFKANSKPKRKINNEHKAHNKGEGQC